MARMAREEPLPGRYRPKMAIMGKAIKLSAGMSQAHSIVGMV
jgi:hypothetical protein